MHIIVYSHPKSGVCLHCNLYLSKSCQFFPQWYSCIQNNIVSTSVVIDLYACRLPIPRPGEVLGLVGTNGIGKSTALKILAGKQKPNLGKYDVSITGANWPHF